MPLAKQILNTVFPVFAVEAAVLYGSYALAFIAIILLLVDYRTWAIVTGVLAAVLFAGYHIWNNYYNNSLAGTIDELI